MDVSVNHNWIPVDNRPGVPYCFPQPLPKGFRGKWSVPAIYRWVVFRDHPGDLRRLYIGETDQLGRRIYGYLNPGVSQFTNQRIKARFEDEISSGCKVVLEVLHFDPFALQGISISEADLADKAVRRMLENLFVVFFTRSGYQVLNA